MSRWIKLLIGLAAALAVGWIGHGPLGQGAAFIDRTEALAKAVVRASGVADIEVRLGRDPLSRTAFMSGPANDFQRHGIGRLPGLDGLVGDVPGVSGVRWSAPGGGIPLLAETLILCALFYLIGVGFGWVFFRPRREGFL